LKQFGADQLDENYTRLRRVSGISGNPGKLFEDEGMTIDEADLCEGAIVMIEEGAPLHDNTINVSFSIMLQDHAPRQAKLDKRWTIQRWYGGESG
jgi:hypothetical protein